MRPMRGQILLHIVSVELCAGTHSESVIAAWASENDMKVMGKELSLPTCDRVYELDVQYNSDLSVALKLLGSGHPGFLNGEREIGRVNYDRVAQVTRVVFYPKIRDR